MRLLEHADVVFVQAKRRDSTARRVSSDSVTRDASGSPTALSTVLVIVDAVVVNQDRVIANAARRSDNELLNWHSDERARFLAHRERFAHGLR